MAFYHLQFTCYFLKIKRMLIASPQLEDEFVFPGPPKGMWSIFLLSLEQRTVTS